MLYPYSMHPQTESRVHVAAALAVASTLLGAAGGLRQDLLTELYGLGLRGLESRV